MWNHSMSEVVNSLIKNGLKLEELIEYDYSPYDCFDKTKKIEIFIFSFNAFIS